MAVAVAMVVAVARRVSRACAAVVSEHVPRWGAAGVINSIILVTRAAPSRHSAPSESSCARPSTRRAVDQLSIIAAPWTVPL